MNCKYNVLFCLAWFGLVFYGFVWYYGMLCNAMYNISIYACMSVCLSVRLSVSVFFSDLLVPRLQPGAVSPENTAVAALSAALLHMVSEVVC